MYIKIHTEHGDLKKATPLKYGIFGSPLLNFRCVCIYIYKVFSLHIFATHKHHYFVLHRVFQEDFAESIPENFFAFGFFPTIKGSQIQVTPT